MMAFLTLLGGWAGLARWFAIIGVAASALYMIRDYKNQSAEIAKLEIALSTAKNKIEVVEASRALDRDAIRALDERLKQKAGDLDAFCKILGDIQTNKDANADDVAGEPIGSTLDALKKLDGVK